MTSPRSTRSENKRKPRGPEAVVAERNTADAFTRLQRGMLRLALSFYGHDEELDKKLKELGKLVRKGQRDAKLQRLIDGIIESIVALDLRAKNSADTSGDAAAAPLLRVIDSLQASPELQIQLHQTAQQITHKHGLRELLAHADTLARTLSAALQAPQTDAKLVEIPRDALVELLERMPLPAEMQDAAARTKQGIEAAQTDADLRTCVWAISDLVIALKHGLQNELDGLTEFLRLTTRRLQEFEALISSSRESHVGASNDAMQLSDTMGAQLKAVREDMGDIDSLGALKALIVEKLDCVDDGLATYVETQTERAAEARRSIDNMVVKLQELETETQDLREDLEEQHARVLIDPLTGVLNRAGYVEMGAREIARCKRYDSVFSIGVIDLDLFKQINDTYGHAAGDKVLATVAAKIDEQIRECDIFCRCGGEEFVLILPQTGLADAVTKLNLLRKYVEECKFRYKETPVRVTLSCGTAEFSPNDTLDAVFERADQAMYRAKEYGRNRVCGESTSARKHASAECPA